MPTTLAPAVLSHELRKETSPDLARRRWAIGLSFAGSAIGMIVAAYQTGLLKRLPDILPGGIFDAEKVDSSDYAYKQLQAPDGTLMAVTYGVTAALVAAGGKDRALDNPALPLAAAGKALYDLVNLRPPRPGRVAGEPGPVQLVPGRHGDHGLDRCADASGSGKGRAQHVGPDQRRHDATVSTTTPAIVALRCPRQLFSMDVEESPGLTGAAPSPSTG